MWINQLWIYLFLHLCPVIADVSSVLIQISAREAQRRVTLDRGSSFANRQFQGSMQYGDHQVQADCTCAEGIEARSASKCHVSKVKVVAERGGNGMSLMDLSKMFGHGALEAFQEVQMAEIAKTPMLCLDDRVQEPSLGTPGGDLGEFILAVDSYVDMLPVTGQGRLVTQQMVDRYLVHYLESLPEGRAFTHCTDDQAVNHIETVLQVEGLDLHHPPDAIIENLANVIADPQNVGDMHIKSMLRNPAFYHIERHFVQQCILAFYKILWDARNPLQSRLQLLVLAGDHNPSAFLEISASKGCEDSGFAPLLTPRTERYSVLISHLEAVGKRREELAHFFANRIGNLLPTKLNAGTLLKRIERHGWQALEITGSRIAKNLPLYTLNYV